MYSAARSKILLYSCFTFILGIAVASWLPTTWLKFDLIFFSIIIFSAFTTWIFYKSKRTYAFIFFMVAIFFLALWRYSMALPSVDVTDIAYYNNSTVAFVGVVTKEPDVRSRNTKLTLEVKEVVVDEVAQPVSGKVLLTTRLFPEYNYGDKISVSCALEEPEEFNEFAYDRYLARHDIFALCYYPKVYKTGSDEGSIFFGTVLNIKNKLKDSINFGLLEPEASLLQAMVLGNRRGLPPELLDTFSRAGLSHIIAISGMHIAIISVILMQLFLIVGLPRKWSLVLAVLFLIIYIILIGLPASALRAGLMASLAMYALYLGRLNSVTTSLVLAASVLLLINPTLLRDDIGFQLSFLAVLSIVYIFPIIDSFFDKYKIPKFKGLRDIVTVTLAAQVLTLPIIALNFQQVSVVSPLVNLLVIMLLPFIMISGIVATLLSLVFTSLAWLIFLPTFLLLKYIVWVAEWSVQLPGAYFTIEYIWIGWIILFYIIIAWWLYRYIER